MNPLLKNSLAVIAGLIIGSLLNMGIVMISGTIISPPEGADVTTMEGLKASIHLFQPKHFLFPFLAHALGTFVGALLTAILAATHKLKLALLIGVFFLAGGTANAFMLPSPVWFVIVDVLGAYVPMAWMGYRMHLLLRVKTL